MDEHGSRAMETAWPRTSERESFRERARESEIWQRRRHIHMSRTGIYGLNGGTHDACNERKWRYARGFSGCNRIAATAWRELGIVLHYKLWMWDLFENWRRFMEMLKDSMKNFTVESKKKKNTWVSIKNWNGSCWTKIEHCHAEFATQPSVPQYQHQMNATLTVLWRSSSINSSIISKQKNIKV